MPTFTQVVRRRRRHPTRVYNRSPKMEGCPQKLGICLRVGTTKPKKPNSAVRKIAKIRLASGYNVRAVIPGSGHDLAEHNTVVLQAGRARDIPGVHYRLVRGVADLASPDGFVRQNRRSKFGCPNLLYFVRSQEHELLQIVSRLRSARHAGLIEAGLPLDWSRGRKLLITTRGVIWKLPTPDEMRFQPDAGGAAASRV